MVKPSLIPLILSNKSRRSAQKPVYHENDVKELKIVDYFSGMNRLTRYIKKSKERFKRANRVGYRSKPKNPLINSYK